MLLIFSKPLDHKIINAATDKLELNIIIMAVSIGEEMDKNLGAISSSYEYELHLRSFEKLKTEAVSKVGEWIDPRYPVACKSFFIVYSFNIWLKMIKSLHIN